MNSYFVYIVASRRNGTIYTGVTNDLVRRASEHRDKTASWFTRKYGVAILVGFEEHSDPSSAIVREKQIKGWNRVWKIKMIERRNPQWLDLGPSL